MTSHPDLDKIRAMADQAEDDAACVRTANQLITEHQATIEGIRKARDHVIRRMAAVDGPAETARRTGMKLPTIAVINRAR